MVLIPLYHGKGRRAPIVDWARVDAKDAPLVASYRWHLKREPGGLLYATRYARVGGGYRLVYMHRAVMTVDGRRRPDVDHRDGDGLNNTRANLRLCTHAQNMQNRRQKKGAARFRGVQQLPSGRWRARYGHRVHIGTFDSELEAALAARHWRAKHAPFADPSTIR